MWRWMSPPLPHRWMCPGVKQVRLNSAPCHKHSTAAPAVGRRNNPLTKHGAHDSFIMSLTVSRVSTACLWSDNLNSEGVLEFLLSIRGLMRDDFCNSDRRRSLSVLLVTLNASKKSMGRRQETWKAPKKPGAFCSSFALTTPKKMNEQNHSWSTERGRVGNVVFEGLMLIAHQVHEVKSRASRCNHHGATMTPSQKKKLFLFVNRSFLLRYCSA